MEIALFSVAIFFISYLCLIEPGRGHFRSRFLHTCLCSTGHVPKWLVMKKTIDYITLIPKGPTLSSPCSPTAIPHSPTLSIISYELALNS